MLDYSHFQQIGEIEQILAAFVMTIGPLHKLEVIPLDIQAALVVMLTQIDSPDSR